MQLNVSFQQLDELEQACLKAARGSNGGSLTGKQRGQCLRLSRELGDVLNAPMPADGSSPDMEHWLSALEECQVVLCVDGRDVRTLGALIEAYPSGVPANVRDQIFHLHVGVLAADALHDAETRHHDPPRSP